MVSRGSILKHPLHPMIVPIAIGLWLFSLFCDAMMLATADMFWSRFSFIAMAGGTLGAVIAALPGLVDLSGMKPSPVKRIAIWHMGVNLVITGIYFINLLWRRDFPPATGQVALSAVAVLLLLVSGWLGGEMVYVHGAAVDKIE